MIVCRRPLLIFDVDLYGAGSLATIGLLASLGLGIPLRHVWTQYASATENVTLAESHRQRAALELSRLQEEVGRLRSAVERRAQAVPGSEGQSDFSSGIARLAHEAGLELAEVAPQRARREGDYVVADVHLKAHGSGLAFLRFFDAASQRHPNHTVERLLVTRAETPDGNAPCTLACTLRLYMTPDAFPGAGP